MRWKKTRNRIVALFLIAIMCTSLCTGVTVNAGEMNKSAGEGTEQIEIGRAEEVGELDISQAEEQEEEMAESLEIHKTNSLLGEVETQEEQETSENQEEKLEEQEQLEKQERKEKSRTSTTELHMPRIAEDSGMEAGQKVTWDCVWFGSYPQSEVTGVDPVYSILQNASGWNNNEIMVNGNQYRRMLKKDATYATSGVSYYYNWSDADTYHYFKYEPIKWRVLNIDGNQALLLSDVVLDGQKYHTIFDSVTWETSSIRSWLNGYVNYNEKNFIGSAFTLNEQSIIGNTFIVNADNIYEGTEGGNSTTDKIFFLSETEMYGDSIVSYCFNSSDDICDEASRCKSSTYAKAMGVWSSTDNGYRGNCGWWLRTPGVLSCRAAYVNFDGSIEELGVNVSNIDRGVRPALKLNISSNQWSYAGTVCSDGTVEEVGDGSSSGSSDKIDIPEEKLASWMEYDKFQARFYSQNASFITGGIMTYSEIEDNYTPTQYALNHMLSFGWNKKFGFSDDAQIWETMILDILFQNTASSPTIEDWEKDSVELSKELVKFISENDLADIEEAISTDAKENLEGLAEKVGEAEGAGGSADTLKVVGKLMEAAKTVKEFIDMYAKYVKLRKVVDVNIKAFLNQMKNTDTYRNIPAFQRALDKIIANIEAKPSDLVQLLIKEKASEVIVKKAINKVVGETAKLLLGEKIYALIDITKSTTIYLMNTICGTSELSQANIYLYMLDRIDDAAAEAFENAAKLCLDSNGEKSYRAVNGGLQFIISLSAYGVSVCRNWNDVIATDILTRLENGTYLSVKRKQYDKATTYLNLNHASTKDERKRYIEEKCQEDERYIDAVLKNQPAFARIQWYQETGQSEDERSCLVLFKVQNPDGSSTIYAQVAFKNAMVQSLLPNVGSKNGYKKPTRWYIDKECTKEADVSGIVTEDCVYYTKYMVDVLFSHAGSGGIVIHSMKGGAAVRTARKVSVLSRMGEITDSRYEIPAYIDGYRVVELGDDIFASCTGVEEVSIPGTIVKISDSAFASLSEDTLYKYVEGSAAEKYIKDKKYKNTEGAKEFYFKDKSVNMYAGDTKRLNFVQSGSSAFEEVTWKSSDENIAKVKDGMVTAVKKGKAVITVSTKSLEANCEVIVQAKNTQSSVSNTVKVSGITLSGISKKIAAGKKIRLTAEVTPPNASNKALTWKSSNTKVATVNSKGVVTLKKNSGGKKVTITATAKDGSKKKATYKITSMKGVVKKVAISGKKTRTIKAGRTLKLKAKVTASNSKKANKTLKWTSSNTKYATVSSAGKVTIKKAGKGKKVTITAMATDGSNKKASVKVKIK